MNPKNTMLETLKNNINHYSDSQKVLARLILTNYQEIAFMTIKEFAGFSGISEATIVRFVKYLKYEGYPGFQKELQRIIRADLKGNERFKIALDSKGNDEDIISDIIEKEIGNLLQLQKISDSKSIDKAVMSIKNATEVIIIGTRSTAFLACHLDFGLSKLEIRSTRILSINSEIYEFLARLNINSLVIVIGYPRYLNELIEILEFCKEKKLKTMAITDNPASPLVADDNLYSPAESSTFIAFGCAPLVLINAIIVKTSLLNKDETLSALGRYEKLAESRKLFAKR
jgi:DNA-binding MurR/RpiR family transcriptional regulator